MSLDLDNVLFGVEDEAPEEALPTEEEISRAIVILHARQDGDILKTADLLAAMLEPYGLDRADLMNLLMRKEG